MAALCINWSNSYHLWYLHFICLHLSISHLNNLYYQSPKYFAGRRRRARGRPSGRRVKLMNCTKLIPIHITHVFKKRVVLPSPRRNTCYWNQGNIQNVPLINRKIRIKLGMWDARSVNNKVVSLAEIVISNFLDIFINKERSIQWNCFISNSHFA